MLCHCLPLMWSHLSRYSLEWHPESDSSFDIDTVEGTVSTNEYLDRETAVWHNVTVVATKVSTYPKEIATVIFAIAISFDFLQRGSGTQRNSLSAADALTVSDYI